MLVLQWVDLVPIYSPTSFFCPVVTMNQASAMYAEMFKQLKRIYNVTKLWKRKLYITHRPPKTKDKNMLS